MKITFFSTKPYDKTFFTKQNKQFGFKLEFYETHLGPHIVNVIDTTDAVCIFVNDKVSAEVINTLAQKGVKIIALRCAGFNNVDLEAAKAKNIKVCRVPAYSPEAIAEHAVAMLLTLVRKTHKAYNRVREQNFMLTGLLGFNLCRKTVGIIGTGNIGEKFAKIMLGFGCRVLAFDVAIDKELENSGVEYLPVADVFKQSDIISLHCPLNDETYHIINKETLATMQPGVTIINTGRGGLIDAKAAIHALKSKQIGHLGIDVYEQEEKLFFRDLSSDIIEDDTIQRLTSFPNVLITAHQAFFTAEALQQISATTLNNINDLMNGKTLADKAAELA